jgi:acyl carrier protein
MVTKADTLRLLDEMLNLPAGSVTGGERLGDLDGWDSLSVLVFIAHVDKAFGVPLPGGRVAQCKTVDELCALVHEATSARAA